MILDANTKLQCVLSGADSPVTNIYIAYDDVTSTGDTYAPITATTSGTTAVDLLAAKAGRAVRSIHFCWLDTNGRAITFRLNNGGTLTTLLKITPATGDTVRYERSNGWFVLDKNGMERSVISQPGRLIGKPKYITTGTTYVIPVGCTAIDIELMGAGGGTAGSQGGGGTLATSGGGGAAGGYLRAYIANPQTTTITIAIGAGGAAGSAGGNAGGTGGDTTFACNSVTYTAKGGKGGAQQQAASATPVISLGAAGVIPTNGDINQAGMDGGYGLVQDATLAHNVSGFGGSTIFGGGGRGSNTSGLNTTQGFGSAPSGFNENNVTGAGGIGAGGIIVVREFY